MKSPVLVTGAQGFIGRYTVEACLRHWPGRRIIGIGRSVAKDTFTHSVTIAGSSVIAPLADGLSVWNSESLIYRSVDIRDRGDLVDLLKEQRPSLVLHLASGLRDDLPSHLFPTNVEGTIVLLEALAQAEVPVERVVVGSSGSIYGDAARKKIPLEETTGCQPSDYYAVSKLAAEQVARIGSRLLGIPVVAARIFNVIGAGQEERHVVGRFASQLAAIAAGKQSPRLELGDLTPTRDFIDVRDVSNALMMIADNAAEPAYNIASGTEASIALVLQILLDIAGLAQRVELVETYSRAADVPRYFGDITRLEQLGFVQTFSLRESLRAVFEYYARLIAAAL